jgi:hypothetical protein
MVPNATLRSPFLPRALEIVVQLLAAVDAKTGKGSAAKVVHEDVQGHQQAEAGGAGAHTEIIVVEEPQAIALVEAADLLQHSATHQQAKPRQAVDLERLTGRGLPATGSEGG